MKQNRLIGYFTFSYLLLSISCKKNTENKTEAEINETGTIEITNSEPLTKKEEKKRLNPELPPSSNFDLKNWYLSVPTDTDNNGKADSIEQGALNAGYESSEFFYTGADGGMVFKCPVKGFTTSKNTKYVRVELREMLRNGDTLIKTKGVTKNNWVFSSAPEEDLKAAGAVDGEMTATLAVNKVTTTGKKGHVGRLIIGQIHSNTDEPIRIYYRKLPNNELGSIYFAHETNHADDTYFDIIGSKNSDIENPEDELPLMKNLVTK